MFCVTNSFSQLLLYFLYRDGLDNPNRQRGSDQETDVVPKKGLQATPEKDEGLRYSASTPISTQGPT